MLVLPVGDLDNPLAVASVSYDAGVSSLRLTGRMVYSCHIAGGKSMARMAMIDNSSSTATSSSTPASSTSARSLLVTADLSGRALGGRCLSGEGAGGFAAQLQAEATFDDHTVERSALLRVRFKTVNVAQLNIIGADATAVAGGLAPFADRLAALTTAVTGFDVVALQEVGTVSEVTELATRAGYPFTTIATGSKSFPDLAFLSRLPLTDVRTDPGPKPGCVLGLNCGGPVWIHSATISVDGRPIRIVNIHVSADFGDLDRSAYRAAQARFIKDNLIDPFQGRVLIAGDFNGNYDLAQPGGPLLDSGAVAVDKTASMPIPTPPDPKWATHCGDRIELILTSPTMFPLTYDGVYGGAFCPPEGLSDHPRVSSIIAI
jgi:endonuclease/exonuclease/phosphatase family metal-dependent hydrolase